MWRLGCEERLEGGEQDLWDTAGGGSLPRCPGFQVEGPGLGWAKGPQCRRDDPFPCNFLWGPVKRQENLPPPGGGGRGSAWRPGCGTGCSVLRGPEQSPAGTAALLLAVPEDGEAEGTDPGLPKRAFPRGDRQQTGLPATGLSACSNVTVHLGVTPP